MDDNQIKICVALVIPYFFATLITAARFVSRYIGKQRLWLDDYLIIPAFVSIRRAESLRSMLNLIGYSSVRLPE